MESRSSGYIKSSSISSRAGCAGRSHHGACRGTAGDVAGGPGPLEVEPADPAVTVENFSGEIEAVDFARFHRAEVDLRERDAAGCDFRIIPAAVGDDRQRQTGQAVDNFAAGVP